MYISVFSCPLSLLVVPVKSEHKFMLGGFLLWATVVSALIADPRTFSSNFKFLLTGTLTFFHQHKTIQSVLFLQEFLCKSCQSNNQNAISISFLIVNSSR